MRFPRWRRVEQPRMGGQEAREKAERELEATRDETPYFKRLADEMRLIRERNHLAEAFQHAAHRRHP